MNETARHWNGMCAPVMNIGAATDFAFQPNSMATILSIQIVWMEPMKFGQLIGLISRMIAIEILPFAVKNVEQRKIMDSPVVMVSR